MSATAERDRIRAYVAAFDAAWLEWAEPGHKPAHRDGGWQRSISQFAQRGLELDWLLVAVDQSMSAGNPWKYLCGMCHRHLAEDGR